MLSKSARQDLERFEIKLFEISLSSQKIDFQIFEGNTEPYSKSNINTQPQPHSGSHNWPTGQKSKTQKFKIQNDIYLNFSGHFVLYFCEWLFLHTGFWFPTLGIGWTCIIRFPKWTDFFRPSLGSIFISVISASKCCILFDGPGMSAIRDLFFCPHQESTISSLELFVWVSRKFSNAELKFLKLTLVHPSHTICDLNSPAFKH